MLGVSFRINLYLKMMYFKEIPHVSTTCGMEPSTNFLFSSKSYENRTIPLNSNRDVFSDKLPTHTQGYYITQFGNLDANLLISSEGINSKLISDAVLRCIGPDS